MKNINEIEFECPLCGQKHNIMEWLDESKLDGEWVLENLSEDGIIRLSFAYMECGCGSEYVVDVIPGSVMIYDGSSQLIFDEPFKQGKE